MTAIIVRACALVFALTCATSAWPQGAPARLTMVIFNAPSLGAFLPPVIKARRLDLQNGLDITFVERTPDAYALQFNSGEFQVGGSAAVLTVGIARTRGVPVTYLFNLYDFWGALVTSNSEVQSVRDLAGRQIAAARGTTNFAMIDWFARRLGMDAGKVAIINSAQTGLMSYAISERADAVQLWEPNYTQLIVKKPSVRTLDLDIKRQWKQFSGGESLPALGVAAHEAWIRQNPKQVEALYRIYKAAAEWTRKNPSEAADLILPKGSNADRLAIRQLIEHNDRLALNVVGAVAVRKEIEAVFNAGLSIKYLEKMPDAGAVYAVQLK